MVMHNEELYFQFTIFNANLTQTNFLYSGLDLQSCYKWIQGEGQPQLEQKAKKEQGKKPPEVVVAIYDFRGAEQGDLSLLKVTVHL